MVPISSPSPSRHRSVQDYAAIAALLGLPLLLFLFSGGGSAGGTVVEVGVGDRVQVMSVESSNTRAPGGDGFVEEKFELVAGEVTFDSTALPFYHCGTSPAISSLSSRAGTTELILLHGAAFSKEDWKTSGILEKFCADDATTNPNNDRRPLSVTALDLSVKSDGAQLVRAFDALVKGGVLTGDPVSIVTPSASGAALVDLGEPSSSSELSRVVQSWIPVASFSVMNASNEVLRSFFSAGVPVLAVNGDRDSRGRDVTTRLVDVVGADGVELAGRHPCYLDSPDEFVATVLSFLAKNNF